jgi:hypothetical protein
MHLESFYCLQELLATVLEEDQGLAVSSQGLMWTVTQKSRGRVGGPDGLLGPILSFLPILKMFFTFLLFLN